MEKDVIQIKNPETHQYAMIDRITGEVLELKTTVGPYKDIPEVILQDRKRAISYGKIVQFR
jgi:hypothetical protein